MKGLASQMPSSRLSLGMAGRVQDIVAVFPQGEPSDPSKMVFREHLNKSTRKVFSAKCPLGAEKEKEVELLGEEEKAGDGYEYVLAVVDKKTNRAVEFRPTTLVSFKPRFRPSDDLLLGKMHKKDVVDYSADFTAHQDLVKDRRRLTAHFGTVKKNKFLDAYTRRSVTSETLQAMTSTAFSSTNTLSPDAKVDNDDKGKISLLQQAASSVLPKPNMEAKTPSDVYQLQQFLPDVGEVLEELSKEATEFFTVHDSLDKLRQIGTPTVVAKRVGNPLRYASPGKRCTLALKMIALSRFVIIIFKIRSISHISPKEVDSTNLPPKIVDHIRSEYLGDSTVMTGRLTIHFSDSQKHRLLADLLCLMLLFDEPDYVLPISPLVQDLSVSENMFKNLLAGLGCVITVASEAQALSMNTIRIARLAGPPEKGARFSDGKRKRKSNRN